MPDLDFHIETGEVAEFAAVPTLKFQLRIKNRQPEPVGSIMLHTQIRIAPNQRSYNRKEQARLGELFGEPSRWGHTVKSLLWTHSVSLVPPFTGQVVIEMPITCTYDFDILSAKYFHAAEEGDIPLEFLFSGTMFYHAASGDLRIERIPWEKEARFRLPAHLWKDMMAHFFPGCAWMRVSLESFDRLYFYKVRRGLPNWDAALESLFRASEKWVES